MNGLRVAWLTLSQPTGALESHSTQGLIVVILGALALGGWIRLLGHIPSRAPRNPQPSERVQAAATLPRTRVLGLIVLFVSLGLSPRLPPPLNGPSSMAQAALEQRTRGLAGRADLETALDLEFLGSVEAGAWLQRTFEVEGRSVTLYVGADDQRNRTQSLRSPKTAYPGSGWMLLEQRPLSIEAGSPRIEASVMRSPNGRQLVYHWTEGYGSLSTAGLRAWLALDQTLGSDAPVAFTMRLSTSLDASPTARFAADDRLRDVMGRLSPPSSSRSPRRVRRPGRRRPSRARTASERASDARSSPTSRGSDSGVLQ